MHYIDETCWEDYKQIGMKKKSDRMVPNCVPVEEATNYCPQCLIEYIERSVNENDCISIMEPGLNEAEYQGRKVQLGKIMQGDIKKFKVYVKNDKGKVVKVNFGFVLELIFFSISVLSFSIICLSR